MNDRPVHRPAAPDAPIPGRHWYGGCDPDRPTVTEDGRCESCGEEACPECGHGLYPDGECACPGSRRDRIDELLPHLSVETRARVREVALDVARTHSMSLEDAQLAALKAWPHPLEAQQSQLLTELRLLRYELWKNRPRCSANGRLAVYVHEGQEGAWRPLHRLLWRLFLPSGLGPFYSEGER